MSDARPADLSHLHQFQLPHACRPFLSQFGTEHPTKDAHPERATRVEGSLFLRIFDFLPISPLSPLFPLDTKMVGGPPLSGMTNRSISGHSPPLFSLGGRSFNSDFKPLCPYPSSCAGHCDRHEENSCAVNCRLRAGNCSSPLTPIIPAHPGNSPVTPIIPALTRTPGVGGVLFLPTLHQSEGPPAWQIITIMALTQRMSARRHSAPFAPARIYMSHPVTQPLGFCARV